MIRPIRPEDEPAHHEFLSCCSPDDLRLRFFHLIRRLPHSEMARLTQIDYDREMAFVAVAQKSDGTGWETLGVVRTFTDLHNDKAEYAILVRSDLKGQRLGCKLMEKIIQYTRSRGTKRIVGLVLADNRKMLDLVKRLGFAAGGCRTTTSSRSSSLLQGPVPTALSGAGARGCRPLLEAGQGSRQSLRCRRRSPGRRSYARCATVDRCASS